MNSSMRSKIIDCHTPKDRCLMARLLTQIGEGVYCQDLVNDGNEEWVMLEYDGEWIGTKEYSNITMEDFINDYIMPNIK